MCLRRWTKVKKKCMSLGNLSKKKKEFYHAFDLSLTLQAYLRSFDPSVVGSLH